MTGPIPERGMWRHFARLPLDDPDHIVTLGEGDTPLLDLSERYADALGVAGVFAKAEDRNPTGSFKARIAAVAHSIVAERGLAGTVGTSSGNGGAAAAAYAAAGGSRTVLFTLADTVPEKMREILAPGGTAYRVAGVGHDACSTIEVADLIARIAHERGFYPMLTGFHYAPEAMRGVCTIAFELAEEAPELTHVYLPVGGGGLLTGVHRGYLQCERRPCLVGVHPAGASALQEALDGHPEGIKGQVTSTISGLQMAALYDAEGAVAALHDTAGHAVAVTDTDVWAAQAELAACGLLVEPAGATAFAGLLADTRAGRLNRDDRVAVLLTGAGSKDGTALDRLAGPVTVPLVEVAELPDVLDRAIGGRR